MWKIECKYQKTSLCSYFCCSNITILSFTATQSIKQCIGRYKKDISGFKWYASNCSTCRHMKAYTVQKQGLFNLLPIPNRKWMDLSLDFIVKLPKSRQQNCVFQHILVVVDQLTKQQLYKTLETIHTSKFINVIYCCIFASYRFLLTMVNN